MDEQDLPGNDYCPSISLYSTDNSAGPVRRDVATRDRARNIVCNVDESKIAIRRGFRGGKPVVVATEIGFRRETSIRNISRCW